MKYPFEFKEMLLTQKTLDVLGFTDYWSESGDFGSRCLDLGMNVHYPKYCICVLDERNDSTEGYGEAEYASEHFCSRDFKKNLYFLHDLYEDISQKRPPEQLQVFIELTKKKEVNMWPFLKSYIDYKSTPQYRKSNYDYKSIQS